MLRYLFPDNGGSHLFVSSRPSYALVYTVGLLACVGAPIVEELFFRGLVQTVLIRNLGTTPAIVVQAMLFGARALRARHDASTRPPSAAGPSWSSACSTAGCA